LVLAISFFNLYGIFRIPRCEKRGVPCFWPWFLKGSLKMTKRKLLVRLTCMALITAVALFYGGLLYGVEHNSTESSGFRSDLIQIDVMTAFGRLEKQPVEFLHDAHTEALAGKNLGCTTCHLVENNRISIKFKRIKDADRKETMNVYHKGCISCHGEMKVAKEKAGPIECEGCHGETSRYTSSRLPMGFDKSLHFRHSKAEQNKCEKCHHEYDEKDKKLFYAKDREGTCRYCHGAETRDSVISMRLASHTACIDCHLKNQEKNIKSGPATCRGCHASEERNKIKQISPVPRMERKQPDIVVMKSEKAGVGTGTGELNRMNAVAFDHRNHEAASDTCRVCHHETMKPCNECHTLTGIKEGNGVTLEKAMHQPDAGESCMGCHARQQEKKNCSGCHAPMGKTIQKEEKSCGNCHMMPAIEKGKSVSPDAEKAFAADMLGSRKKMTGALPENEIPEKIIIDKLSKEYEAVDFPHRRIVKALVNNIKDSTLAAYFHNREGSICKGCHHNAPVSKNPPPCASCHAKAPDVEDPVRPAIVGAYHLQCIGCHNNMKIKKPDGCTGCHKEKK
jgi:hypothetical protein